MIPLVCALLLCVASETQRAKQAEQAYRAGDYLAAMAGFESYLSEPGQAVTKQVCIFGRRTP